MVKDLRIFIFLAALSILMINCGTEKKPEKATEEQTAVEALPENIGDQNAPTAIKALKGAKEVKRQMDVQRKEDSEVLKESN
jgi:hypothetical protein